MRPTRGFSLVEVMIALGLLATVLISISSLFLFAGRQIDSGRTQSAALAVARDVMEQLHGRAYRDVYAVFGLSGSAAAYTVDSRSNSFAAPWQQALDAELHDARAWIGLESIADGAAPPLDRSRALRVTVTVHWREGPRARDVRLATVRM